MGNERSNLVELCPTFDTEEVLKLFKRLRKADLEKSGALTIDEIMAQSELRKNPLLQRIFDIFGSDSDGEVDFKELIQGLSQFSVQTDKLSKLRFAFRIYDVDNDGYISNGELFQVVKMMVGDNINDTELQQVVDKTIFYADRDEDGLVSFEEFCQAVGYTDIHKMMVVHV